MDDVESVAEESGLSRAIEELIARDLGIDPNEVTPEFIHRWRQGHLYPNAQHGLNTKYGGYNGSRSKILSSSEVIAARKMAERFIESLVKPSTTQDPKDD